MYMYPGTGSVGRSKKSMCERSHATCSQLLSGASLVDESHAQFFLNVESSSSGVASGSKQESVRSKFVKMD